MGLLGIANGLVYGLDSRLRGNDLRLENPGKFVRKRLAPRPGLEPGIRRLTN
jgi:hypothetical protein